MRTEVRRRVDKALFYIEVGYRDMAAARKVRPRVSTNARPAGRSS